MASKVYPQVKQPVGKTFPQLNTMCKRWLKELWIIKKMSKNYPQVIKTTQFVRTSTRMIVMRKQSEE